jgi:ribosomal protein L37AE/L43A
MSSGGYDNWMLAVTDTYICKSCKKIVDVNVGEYGVKYTKEEVLDKKKRNETGLDFYLCPEYGSNENLVKWSIRSRPCPKCDGKMKKDIYGDTVLWD